ncbi:phosphorylated protein phosphatase [Spiroplasma syrphidicola EA-1]|uniref:Phosphorylated protein phosphatase n=1 Tax=Spiroplasma syrphidicola EA-1 TaxID=1276229 RepID=R4UMD9_9MOLU|nr:protein phosphatase 2C domain-containing protein [Spiroplasma syrphidicola]AGM26401.1 phosphorylated protein phosphatase [Spiroplasma syrphidicola EA-1]
MINVRFGFKTDIGAYRSSNQDNFDFATNNYNNHLAIVCDGMGGHQHGEVASKIAVEEMINYFHNVNFNAMSDEEINQWFRNTILVIQNEMINYAKIHPDTSDMGTTVVAALLANQKVYIINIGDSRLYKLHNHKIYQITTDQNMENSVEYRERQELEFQGQYKKQYNVHTFWKVLTSALGPTKTLKIDTYVVEDIAGTYLLTTDGIHDYVDDTDLVDVLSSSNKLNDKVKILIDRALENLSTDNLTGLIFEID